MEEKRKPQGKIKENKDPKRKSPPARSAESREKQLVNMAMDLAEKQLEDGTATSQVITHFLKLGTETERLNREKVENENALLKAKVDQLASQQRIEELYVDAISAMRMYSGTDEDHLLEDDILDDD